MTTDSDGPAGDEAWRRPSGPPDGAGNPTPASETSRAPGPPPPYHAGGGPAEPFPRSPADGPPSPWAPPAGHPETPAPHGIGGHPDASGWQVAGTYPAGPPAAGPPPYTGPPPTEPPPRGWRPPLVVQPVPPRQLPAQDPAQIDRNERSARTLTLGVGMIAGAVVLIVTCLLCSRVIF